MQDAVRISSARLFSINEDIQGKKSKRGNGNGFLLFVLEFLSLFNNFRPRVKFSQDNIVLFFLFPD